MCVSGEFASPQILMQIQDMYLMKITDFITSTPYIIIKDN